MNILYMTNYTPFPVWAIIVICLAICVIIAGVAFDKSNRIRICAAIVAAILCAVVIAIPVSRNETVPRMKYYVTLEDASVEDIFHNYNIEEQKGELYIISDKVE